MILNATRRKESLLLRAKYLIGSEGSGEALSF
jgi:hypothetical protein